MSFDARLLTGLGVMAAVVESGSFVRAAEALALTPSGVSRAVARLEAKVGVRLFDRSPRAVSLTDEGRRLYGQVAPLMAGIEEAAAEAAGAAASVRGRLRVNIDPWFARLLLAPRLNAFMDPHPGLSVELIVRSDLGDMIGDGFDVAIRFGFPQPSSLIARKLLETRILTFAAPAYLERHGEPKTPQDVVGRECILFRDSATGRPFPWEFHRRGEVVEVKVAGRLQVNDPMVMLETCVAGQGLAQSFALGLQPWLDSGRLVQVLPGWAEERFPLYAYHPSRRQPPAKVRAFLDLVQQIAAGAQTDIL